VLDILEDTMLIHGFKMAFGMSDTTRCDWVAFNSRSKLAIRDILPEALMEKYPSINFKIMIVYQHPITGDYLIFLPEKPQLLKNIVPAIEIIRFTVFSSKSQVWKMPHKPWHD